MPSSNKLTESIIIQSRRNGKIIDKLDADFTFQASMGKLTGLALTVS